MWEVLVRTPLGKHSLRKFVLLSATILVASFGYLLASAAPVLAADATFSADGTTLTHEGTDYRGPYVDSGSPDIPVVEDNASFFLISDSSAGTASIIYFPAAATANQDFYNATTAQLVTYDYSDSNGTSPGGTIVFSDPSSPTSVTIIPRAPPENTNTSGTPTDGYTSCVVEGIGWLICPVTREIAQWMDTIYGIVAQFLEVRTLATDTNQPMYRAWSFMRDIANVLFVIGFLILVYGQVSGGMISNYTIKKTLPRIIVAAVMVNVSYWICAIAVDVFNILGYALQDLFNVIRNSLVGPEGNQWEPLSAAGIATLVLSGGAAGAAVAIGGYVGVTTLTAAVAGATVLGGIGALIAIFLPILIATVFVVFMSFLILAARQAIITILIVLAPLAFVAYLLPNTEKWFERWRTTLVTLLFVFPAFSVVFGGSQLAAALILQNSGDAIGPVMVILAFGVQIIPLAITPLLLRLGGGVLNRFAGVVNNPTKGVFDRGKNWANERRDDALARGNRHLAGLENQGRLPNGRFGARRMAYSRQRNKLAREGERSANDALTKGYFTQTAGGQRISRLNERAKMEQGIGDNENQAAWENEVRTSPNLRARAIRSHDAHNRAALYKGEVDAAASEHWQHSMATNAGLRAIQTDTHLASGRAKLTEEALKNADERTLQTQITGNAALRGIKVQSDVDAAHAQFQAANVTAEGKAAFQNEIYTSPALQQMNTETVSFEKQASTMENTLKQRAEESWERNSKTDAYLQNLRLNEVQATDAHKKAEAQWNNLVENVRIKGGNTPGLRAANRGIASSIRQLTPEVFAEEATTKALQGIIQSKSQQDFSESNDGRILNIRSQAAQDSLEATKAEEAALVQEWRTEKGSEGLSGEKLRLAQELQDADIEKRARTQRAGAAKRVSDVEYAQAVMGDEGQPPTALAIEAGGIEGEAGISQAKSVAFKTIVDAFNTGVAAEKTPLSRTENEDLLGSEFLGNDDILDQPSEKIAAIGGTIAGRMHQLSHTKLWRRMGQLQKIASKELDDANNLSNNDPTKPAAVAAAKDKLGKVKDLQQQVMGDKKKTPFGIGDYDMGKADVGDYDGDPYEGTRTRLNTHMSGETLAHMDPDDQRLIFEMARLGKLNDTQLLNVAAAYDEWQNDDNLKSSIQNKHRNLLDPIKQHVETAGVSGFPQPGDPTPAGTTPNFWSSKYPEIQDDTVLPPITP